MRLYSRRCFYSILLLFSIGLLIFHRRQGHPVSPRRIAIVIVLEPNSTGFYTRAMDSVKCYSQIHGYSLKIVNAVDYSEECPMTNQFFKRHCVVRLILPNYDYILFLDADIGVVNPKRRIEEFIDPSTDIIFYDRFYNHEITAGSYIVKNTQYSLEFLEGFALYTYRLPWSIHGADNGALEIYIAEKLFPNRPEVYKICAQLWKTAANYDDLFTYEACMRAVVGTMETFPHIRILPKGTGWARDGWITNSLWDPQRDFMLHEWKTSYLRNYTEIPIRPHHQTRAFYDPLIGQFDFDKCHSGNTSWNYDPNLMSTTGEVQQSLDEYKEEVQLDFYRKLARIPKILQFEENKQ